MNKEDTKQAILGFTEFFKGITGNQDLKIPDDIATALEIGPCDDAISREAIQKSIIPLFREGEIDEYNRGYNDCYEQVLEKIKDLPSVQPRPKTGHNCNEDYADCDQFVCLECGIELQDWNRIVRDDEYNNISYQEYAFRFCPNCGCKIEERRNDNKL